MAAFRAEPGQVARCRNLPGSAPVSVRRTQNKRYCQEMVGPTVRARLAWALGVLSLAIAVGVGFFMGARQSTISLPPASSVSTVVKPLPNVLVAVRDLSRLESVAFHMERVIDLTEKQSRLFGLIQSEDAILLVAVADVTAGVDLGKLADGDVEVDQVKKSARILLPPAEILHASLDNEHTYVHTRRTGLMARRQEALEARARSEAERALLDAAREAGILPRAEESARRSVERLVRSLGYREVEVRVRAAQPSALGSGFPRAPAGP